MKTKETIDMNIQTKFNLDDLVYAVSHERMTRMTVCPVCNGKPPVITGFNVRCQRCHGDGYITNGTYVKYRIAEHGIIGRISTETYTNSDIVPEYLQGREKKGYMITATGIGTGTIWSEEDLFHSKAEAEAYCNMKNQLEEQKDIL